MLGFVSVSLSIGSRPIVQNVTCLLAPHECVVMEGASGTGKSHLLRLLLREMDPTQGKVDVDGVDLRLLPPQVLQLYRQRLGVVFQTPHLLERLTLRENVALPLQLRGIDDTAAMHEAGEILTHLELDHLADVPVFEVSYGDQRLASIARALCGAPPILLLDEPLQGLDPHGAQRAIAAIAAANQSGASVLIFTQHAAAFHGMGARMLQLTPQGLFSEGAAPVAPSTTAGGTGDRIKITPISS